MGPSLSLRWDKDWVRWQAVHRRLSLRCNAKWVPRKPVSPSSSLRGTPNRVWWDVVGRSSSLRRVRWDAVGPSSSLRGTHIGFGGTRWVLALLYVGPASGSVGPGGSQLFSTWDPHRVRWDPVGPSSSLRGTRIGFGGTRWDPVGPSPSLRGTLHPVWVLQC